MATIGQYKHVFLDFIECPGEYELVPGTASRKMAVYQLLEPVPAAEKAFDGREGDLIVGGGFGKLESLRISQKGILYFGDPSFKDFTSYDELYKSFWSPAFAARLGNGFSKVGWNPKECELDYWLAHKVVRQMLARGKVDSLVT